MDEIDRARNVIEALDIDEIDSQSSILGNLLARHDGSIELDTFELYFNRNPKGAQIDLQVGSHVFNLAEWTDATHKLAELLLLKGASIADLERLRELTQTLADTP